MRALITSATSPTLPGAALLTLGSAAVVDAQLAYSDLSGTPTNVSTFTNDAGYLTDITAENIGDLADVDLTGLADGNSLTYNATSGNWEVSTSTVPSATTTTQGVIEIATNAEAQATTATNLAVVPSNLATLPLSTFGDVAYPSAPTNNQVLQWVGASNRWEPQALSAPPLAYSSKTSSFTASKSNHYSVNASAGAITATLPSASTTAAGEVIRFKLVDATNDLTLSPSGADTIDGASNRLLGNPQESLTLVCNGTNGWEII